jgi:hypothetical protein
MPAACNRLGSIPVAPASGRKGASAAIAVNTSEWLQWVETRRSRLMSPLLRLR